MREAAVLVPLYSTDAEMGVLGSMLLSARAAEEMATLLEPTDFYRTSHGIIFEAMRQLLVENKNIDYLTLKEALVERGELAKAGGEDYLLELAEFTPTAAHARGYADIVLDRSTLRQLEEAGKKIVGIAQAADDATAAHKVDLAEQVVLDVGQRRIGADIPHVRTYSRMVIAAVDDLIETGAPTLGAATGFADLDDITTGFYSGDLIIVAARPSMGKTSLVLDFAIRIARRQPGSVAIFSLEMTGPQIARRMVSMVSGVSAKEMKQKKLEGADYNRLANACEEFYGLPIYVEDASEVSGLEIKGKCRRLMTKGPLSLVIVDYLQLMRAVKNTENRVQEIGDIVRSLKAVAKDLGVPVIALSQLNRGVELRDEKRPQLGDLRESGSIEAEADLVMSIYRDRYYEDRRDPSAADKDPARTEVAEISILKHRNGEVGTVLLGFQPSYARFVSLDRDSKQRYWQEQSEKKKGKSRRRTDEAGE